MATLADLVKGNIFDNVKIEEEEEESKFAQHRHKDMPRPKEEVELLSLSVEEFTPRRSTKDPVELFNVPIGIKK